MHAHMYTGSGNSQISLDAKQPQQISSVHVPDLKPSCKQSQPPRGFTESIFSAFPTFPLFRFVLFLLIVMVCLPQNISNQLAQSNDALILTEEGDSVADFLRSYVISTSANGNGSDKSLPFSVYVVPTSDLRYNTEILRTSAEATREQLQLQSSCKTGLVGTDPYIIPPALVID